MVSKKIILAGLGSLLISFAMADDTTGNRYGYPVLYELKSARQVPGCIAAKTNEINQNLMRRTFMTALKARNLLFSM
jgi:hypothetical protein